MKVTECQMPSVETIQGDQVQNLPKPFFHGVYRLLTRYTDPDLKRLTKRVLKRIRKWQSNTNGAVGTASKAKIVPPVKSLKTGDLVRIRSLDEIQATLDADNRLKGCKFMPSMAEYCGTVQRVYKPLERFLNEWDYTLRTSKGLVLLENLFCQGTARSGRCDRSCFYFWRVEWLDYIEKGQKLILFCLTILFGVDMDFI